MNRHSRTPICASVALALILSLMLPAALAAEEPSFPFADEPVTFTAMVPQTSVIEDWRPTRWRSTLRARPTSIWNSPTS